MESEVLKELQRIKIERKMSYDTLSRLLGFPSQSIARWLGKGKINPLYAEILKERLKKL